ncbi:hypothetical protein HPDFL43_11451 [Hoeflea phototrophica DFL-43]|jgi:hypothetical protein|uniref:HD-CE domain-containing protein n=1 Tax=Hoeflea phototrophica (strain DSM 17068 / NCIMB 14078 / DFL-43) TaxID=411684 RepID=A9DAY2_HOEPD|nr:ATP-binding protein [Hoeflea phototrophica]EDQ32412.1 hypothetical protein HPDFL43_11451 [Hoeflea phototrophica DFL-43]
MDYKDSRIWKRTLGAPEKWDGANGQCNKLATAYHKFWLRSEAASQRIAATLPGLTKHDSAHFHALWHRADQLLPDDICLNPAEAFTFGGAVLLHDIGHIALAYENGLDGVRETDEFKDALALAELNLSNEDEPVSKSQADALDRASLFEAMRALHPVQAVTMATNGLYAEDGERIPLLEDSELVESLGDLVGRIAESHHWPGSEITSRLEESGAPGSMPTDWTIRAGLLAFLLRCADAIQIDQSRADTFSMKLHAPTGLSKLHWEAQRKLAQPTPDPKQKHALKFNSTSPFDIENAAAWWIAYDLIGTADTELRAARLLMEEAGMAPLALHFVSNAGDPEKLAEHIKVTGWKPIRADVKVTSTERMIELFGGAQLYGNDPLVPLRELLQNASDAVRARRALEKDETYKGRIDLSLKSIEGQRETYQFTLRDNGLGMGRYVLAGAFLEFGKSFWTSRDAQREYPGLLAKKLTQTGRYGIGVFSVFMISNDVTVISRRFDHKGAAHKLRFEPEAGLRPILLDADHADFGTASTVVHLRIDQETYDTWHTMYNHIKNKTIQLTLEQRIAMLCPNLDCDVYVDGVLVHSADWFNSNGPDWIRQLGPWADAEYNALGLQLIDLAAERLEVLEHNGVPVGRAAITTAKFQLGQRSTGGLVVSSHLGNQSEKFIGVLPVLPAGPDRHRHTPVLKPEVLAAWASSQAHLIASEEKNHGRRYYAGQCVSEFGGSVRPLACLMGDDWQATATVASRLVEGEEISVPLSVSNGVDYLSNPSHQITASSFMSFSIGDKIKLAESVLFAPPYGFHHSTYLALDGGTSSIVGALREESKALGFELIISKETRTIATYTGKSSTLENLEEGMLLKGLCAIFKAQKSN